MAQGQFVYKHVHNFGTLVNDGVKPYGGVTRDAKGNLFGTTRDGGLNGLGTVWEITSSGTYVDLHDFGTGSDGFFPFSGVAIDPVGNLYGTTHSGGANSCGIVWSITSTGYSDIHDFGAGTDGQLPYAGATIDSSGNLYGTTSQGGVNREGIVWEISKTAGYKDLHDFYDGLFDGQLPLGDVTVDHWGNLYGTTAGGGQYERGTIWSITNSGYKVLYGLSLDGTDPYSPYCGVTLDKLGDLYGTAFEGGLGGGGIVWEFVPGSTTLKDLHDFGSVTSDGLNPRCDVVFDPSGNLYGTTYRGGQANAGTIWEITSGGTYLRLHDFGVSVGDGGYPQAGVTLGNGGSIYGNASFGVEEGAGSGLVWSLTPLQLTGLTVSPDPVTRAAGAIGTLSLNGVAPATGWTINLASGNSNYIGVPAFVTVPNGQDSETFPITTKIYPADYTAVIKATDQITGTKAAAPLTVLFDSIVSVSVSSSTVTGTAGSTGTVTLSAAAPAAGWIVHLNTSAPNYVGVPVAIIVPANQTSATFPIKTQNYPVSYSCVIKANDGFTGAETTLNVLGDSVSSVSVSPNPVQGAAGSTATIMLVSPAPAGGWLVKLSSSSPNYVGVPTTVLVPAGQNSATFPVSTKTYPVTYTATIVATDGPSITRTSITVNPG